MFADPQSITIDAVATSLPKVSASGRTGVYESADGNLMLTISHTNGKRQRSVVRIDHKKVGSDPLNPTTNKPYGSSVYLVVDQPVVGYTDAELKSIAKGLTALVNDAFLTRFLGQES